MTGKSGPASEYVAALEDAIAAYAQSFTRVTAVQRYAESATEPLLVSAPSNMIESVLGQLQTREEARLREPLLAMRLAEATLLAERDPRSADQVSHWAGIFAARLDEMAIPRGTRTNLMAKLAAYEHAVLSTHETLLRQQPGREGPQAAASAVEAALANANRVLNAEQQRLSEAFEVACNGFVWSFGAVLAASLSIVGLGVFGQTVFDHGLVRARHAR